MKTRNHQHIVVVDDDSSIRKALGELLMAMGYGVDAVASAREAINFLSTRKCDCVLLDIAMPEMDGMAALKVIKQIDPDLPVVMITGHGEVGLAVKAMKEGADDFLEKPIDDLLLEAAIQESARRSSKSKSRSGPGTDLIERYNLLTPREREIAEMVSKGHSTQSIAANLSISPRTVDHHRASISEKMQAASLAHLMRMLLELASREAGQGPQPQGLGGS